MRQTPNEIQTNSLQQQEEMHRTQTAEDQVQNHTHFPPNRKKKNTLISTTHEGTQKDVTRQQQQQQQQP